MNWFSCKACEVHKAAAELAREERAEILARSESEIVHLRAEISHLRAAHAAETGALRGERVAEVISLRESHAQEIAAMRKQVEDAHSNVIAMADKQASAMRAPRPSATGGPQAQVMSPYDRSPMRAGAFVNPVTGERLDYGPGTPFQTAQEVEAELMRRAGAIDEMGTPSAPAQGPIGPSGKMEPPTPPMPDLKLVSG